MKLENIILKTLGVCILISTSQSFCKNCLGKFFNEMKRFSDIFLGLFWIICWIGIFGEYLKSHYLN